MTWRLVLARLVDGDKKPYSATNPLPVNATVTVDTSNLETLTGSKTETAPASDTASSGLNGRLQRIAQRLTALLPAALGAGGGLKVDGSGTALPVSAAALPLPTGAATETTLAAIETKTGSLTETAPATDTASSGLNGRLQRIAQRITSLIGLFPTSLGGKVAASSFAVTTATDDPPLALLGAVNETAPASDTASSGLNGRLQRIAQRFTSLIALLPASLGPKLASASLSVASGGLAYETVAASQTDQAMGATGATGDHLSHVLVVPATTAAGSVSIKDGSGSAITIFTGGGTLADLKPITVPVGATSTSGAWKITTGANVSAIGFGVFT